jgi:hypothetical protein
MRVHQSFAAALALAMSTLPSVAQPISCRLGDASFRPVRGAADFELRSRRAGDAIAWDLVVTATGETYPFRTEFGSHEKEWVIVSETNAKGVDPKVSTPLTPRREDGEVAADGNDVAKISMLNLAQGFIAHRERSGTLSGGDASPPSGVWKLSACGSQ